jgi:hypothetical protein
LIKCLGAITLLRLRFKLAAKERGKDGERKGREKRTISGEK